MSAVSIGDPTFIAAFKLIGVDGLEANEAEEVQVVLRESLRKGKYVMIIMPDRYVEATAEIRSKVAKEGKAIPIFSFVPDYTGERGARIKELKKSVSLAVGARLKL